MGMVMGGAVEEALGGPRSHRYLCVIDNGKVMAIKRDQGKIAETTAEVAIQELNKLRTKL